MDLSIIIVSWKVKDLLRANLRAVFASLSDFSFEVYLVDNNSDDGTVAMVKQEFPAVKIIANQKNVGFAKANNQAIREASGDFILLLNPDMKLEVSALKNLLAFMKSQPQAVVASGKLKDEQGKTIKHVRRFPKLLDQLIIILKLPHIFPDLVSRYLYKDFDYSQAAKVDSVRGSFFMINRLAYQKLSGKEKPFLDERYFIWFEEVDFCRQVAAFGGEVWYTPSAEALDLVGQSFKQVNRGRTQRYFRASMLAYFKKWEPRWQYYLLLAVWPLGELLARIFGLLKRIFFGK